MAIETAKRDPNYVTTIMGVGMSGQLPTDVFVDESTHRLLVNAVISGGGASDGAILDGANSAIRATVLTLTSSNPQTVAIVDGTGAQITSFGGGTQYTDAAVPPAHPVGNALLFNNSGAWAAVSAAVPLPVSGTFWQSTQPVSLASVPSHAVTNAGTFAVQATEADGANTTLGAKADAKSTATDTTAITIMSVLKQISASVQAPPSQAVTNAGTFLVQAAQSTAASLNATVVGTGTFVVQATLAAETTKVIGTVNQGTSPWVDNVSQINGVTPLMGNGATGTGSLRVTIASDNTAFSVNAAATLAAETTKVIGVVRTADGTGNLLVSAANALNSTGAGILASQNVAQFDDVSPTAITENQFGNLRMSANRNLYGTIRDAAGNERGANVTAANALSIDNSSIAGTATSVGVGASGTGVQRMVEANNAGKTLATVSGTAASSGNNTLKAAGTNLLKVYAFSLTTTSATSTTCIFQSGASGTELWRVVLQAPTSVNVGANLAVTPPAYLFATASATLLNLNLSGAQTIHYSVAYYDEA